MTEEEIWDYVNRIPGSFGRLNVQKLYEYAIQSPGMVAEVGVDQGRSATVLLLAARETGAHVLLVDLWPSVLGENRIKVSNRLQEEFPDVSWSICHAESVVASTLISPAVSFSLIHIDANHYDDGPARDCATWLPKLRAGGVACFHDYGVGIGGGGGGDMNMFQAVDDAVNDYCAGWEDLGAWEGLGIRRKPAC